MKRIQREFKPKLSWQQTEPGHWVAKHRGVEVGKIVMDKRTMRWQCVHADKEIGYRDGAVPARAFVEAVHAKSTAEGGK